MKSFSVIDPLNFIRGIVLSIVPRVISLGVWADIRVRILDWIDQFGSLN